MASIYKPSQLKPLPPGSKPVRKNGKAFARAPTATGTKLYELSPCGTKIKVPRRCWYVQYLDHDGVRRTTKGYCDKEASLELARKIQREVDRKKSGLTAAEPARGRESYSAALDAFLSDMLRLGRVKGYRVLIRYRLERLGRESGWRRIADLRAASLTTFLATLAVAPSTRNEWVANAKVFGKWLEDQGYVDASPFRSVKKQKRAGQTRPRRALSEAEGAHLLAACAWHRKPVYWFAMTTGLRRAEIAQVTWDDLTLGKEPRVDVRAATTKARRSASLALVPELAARLRELKPEGEGAQGQRVFKRIPTIDTLKGDLARAGIPWLDSQGRRCDFHSLRKSFGSWLAKAGVPVRTTMEMMRHTDVNLTMAVYCDPHILDYQAAAAKLPKLGGAA